jgi:hypothetical protein
MTEPRNTPEPRTRTDPGSTPGPKALGDRVTAEAVSFGYDVFVDGTKLANVETQHHDGVSYTKDKAGTRATLEDMPDPYVHWTRPKMSVAEARAVLDVIDSRKGGGRPE